MIGNPTKSEAISAAICADFSICFLLSYVKVFFSVLFAAMFLGQAGPYFEAIATAQGAAYQVFTITDRVRWQRSSNSRKNVLQHIQLTSI